MTKYTILLTYSVAMLSHALLKNILLKGHTKIEINSQYSYLKSAFFIFLSLFYSRI